VLESVLEHIDERISHLPRAGERAPMPAIRPKPAAPKQHAIHTPCYSHHESAHARRERRGALRFDDEVGVVVLQRVVHDPKLRGIAVAQREQHGF
jgi:hypothetical protein